MSQDMTTVAPVFYDLRQGVPRPMEPPTEPVVMCLGNFDGVHKAHTALLQHGIALRDEKFPGRLCGVFTFFSPSSDYLRDSTAAADACATGTLPSAEPSPAAESPTHLTTLEEKLRLFADTGMDFVCLCDFRDICSLPPLGFLSFLTDTLTVRGAVCGFNYHFGAEGRGDAQLLSAYFDRPQEGFYAYVAEPYCLDGDTVSATRIRRLLTEGHADIAARHLGRPYALKTAVVAGKQLGRKLGYPTANQYFLPESLIPASGVYAVLCHTPQGVFPGVSNIGSHPTVDDHAAVNCETHILGPAQDLYGYPMRVEFLCRLRPEYRFDSVEALTHAIAEDAAAARAYVSAYLQHHD